MDNWGKKSSLIFYFVAIEENPRSTKNASRNLESPGHSPATNNTRDVWKFCQIGLAPAARQILAKFPNITRAINP